MKTKRNLAQFKEFFDLWGVSYDEWKDDDFRGKPVTWLSVSGSHFAFDSKGNYLGVEGDESGEFEPKVEPA